MKKKNLEKRKLFKFSDEIKLIKTQIEFVQKLFLAYIYVRGSSNGSRTGEESEKNGDEAGETFVLLTLLSAYLLSIFVSLRTFFSFHVK